MPRRTAPFPHPKIFGFSSYRDWINKAGRDYERFLKATEPEDRVDHIVNFCSSVSYAIDWAWRKEVSGQPGWTSIKDLGDFRDWLRTRCHAVGKIETVNMASKHAELHTFVPQIVAGSASITGVITMALPDLATFSTEYEGATIEHVEYLVGGGIVENVEIRYSVLKLYQDGEGVWFSQAAKQALSLWKQFDPSKGETQVITTQL